MFTSNSQQQSVAALADAHAMQMANIILSANQNNQLPSNPIFNNNQTSFDSNNNRQLNNNNGLLLPLNQTTITPTTINLPSTIEIQRMQQWFRHNDTSPYTSPLPSNAPSMGDISGISSLFTENNSTITLNSHLSNSSKIIKTENFGTNDAVKFFLSIFSGSEPDLIFKSAKALKLFFDAVNKNSLPMNSDVKDFCDIIRLILSKLKTAKENKMINALLDNLASISSSSHYLIVVREQPIQTLRTFIDLINQNSLYLLQYQQQYSNNNNNFLTSFSSSTTQRITHLLRIFYNTLSEVSDKNEARTEQIIGSLLLFMRIPSTSIRFFSIGILRVLIHANEQLKKFVLDQHGLELILKLISEHQHHRFLRQALRTLTTLIDAKQQIFAEHFVRLGGINLIISRIDVGTVPSSDDLFPALLILKLVSDIPELGHMDLNQAIHLALRGTLPPSIPPITKSGNNCGISGNAVDTFWRNIVNALGFLRNVCALNEKARNYLATFDQGRPISHLVELATQSFDLLFCSSSSLLSPPSSSSSSSPSITTNNNNINNTTISSSTPSNAEQLCCINAEVSKSQVEIGDKRRQMLHTMLDNCLCLLALVNKESINNNGNNYKGREQQKFASKKLAEDERAILLYQLILRLDRIEFQKSVLTSLRRIINSGISLPIESRGIRLAETLLKYLFTHNNSIPLIKIAVDVLNGLVCDQSKLHLNVIIPLLSNANYQPFNLLDYFSNNSDLYLAILKLIKELCQREPALKSLWFPNESSNLNSLKYLKTTSNNGEIVNLCSKIFDLLQMEIGEDGSESVFYDMFTQGMELDQS